MKKIFYYNLNNITNLKIIGDSQTEVSFDSYFSGLPKNSSKEFDWEIENAGQLPKNFSAPESSEKIRGFFAGKIHAVLCRGWENRIKGRDLYDYIFYLSQNAKVNLKHLKARMVQTGHFDIDEELTIEKLKDLLIEKFNTIDYSSAKEDVLPFIKDKTKLDIWNKEFFIDITKNLKGNNKI